MNVVERTYTDLNAQNLIQMYKMYTTNRYRVINDTNESLVYDSVKLNYLLYFKYACDTCYRHVIALLNLLYSNLKPLQLDSGH